MKILILNGPNLNLLGTREPDIYGGLTLANIQQEVETLVSQQCRVEFFQSNHEGALVEKIQQAALDEVKFIIINPAAYTHTSIAIRDALLSVKLPFIEVHISNPHAREKFRHKSYIADIAVGVICGLGSYGYVAAMDYALKYLQKGNK